ncbi:MAG: hypothetical protein KAI91_04925 [Candidatus Omnitrophica bacterium]|nr:hypothetical protein [Candidatus Omnitrophota bacterium]
MKKGRVSFLFLVVSVLVLSIFLSFSAKDVRAEGILDQLDIDVEISGTLDFYSDYVWRGFVLDRDPVFQPGISISAAGFTYSFWSSWDASNNSGSSESDEIDHVIDYTLSLNDLVSLSVGNTYYDFPSANTYSKEFYVGVGFSKIPVLDLPIETSLTFYRDYGNQNNGGGLGNYVSLDCSYSYPLFDEPEVTLDLGTHFGYNRKLFIAGTSGYDLGLSCGLTIPLKDNITVSPSLNYSIPFSDLEDSADGNQYKRFYSGISIAYSF